MLGLEPSLPLYISHIVTVFEEVRRVLRRDGTCWINWGDSYCSSAGQGDRGARSGSPKSAHPSQGQMSGPNRRPQPGLKPKDLCGVPWRCALALQDSGWWLRSEIVWEKPNCLPETARDRPSRSHETVFMLTRSARYWYDAESVREPYSEKTLPQLGTEYAGNGQKNYAENGVQNPSEVKRRIVAGMQKRGGRNLRSVWTIPTESYDGPHFAVFPRRLVATCVKAGCPPGGVVLDMFMGTGTTGEVALSLGRRFLGIERNPEYMPMVAERLKRYEGLGAAPEEAKIQGPRTLSLGI